VAQEKKAKASPIRWAKAGYRSILARATLPKAQATAKEVMELLGGEAMIEGLGNVKLRVRQISLW